MRVAFVTNIIPPYRKSFYYKLSQLSNIELLVVYGVQEKETGRPDAGNKVLFPFRTMRVRNVEKKVGRFLIRWQKGFKQALSSFSPDTIILLGISGTLSNWILGFWARHRNIKVLMWSCGWESQEKGTMAYFLKKLVMSVYYTIPHRMLVYSTKAKQYMQALGVEPGRIDVCYNGIEVDDFLSKEKEVVNKASMLRKDEDVEQRTVFLYVGAMLLEKRVDLLLEAFAHVNRKVDRTYLWLVGDGPDLSFFKTKAEDLNLCNIRFWGRIIDDVDKFFAAADIFVLPGIGGLALNQAMFWKTLCICSEADGTEDDLIIDGITGYRFMKGEVQSLTSTMFKALYEKGTEAGQKMAENSREIIMTRSNVDVMVETFGRNINLLNS